ncbi:MAG: FtsW/RodA/SpoVE family cell cycle protein, partial [Gallionellaceae bacterium]|nr:FtsW/RodA/SpoVE family cell cycle protein [Gallionellaceae bacterium]
MTTLSLGSSRRGIAEYDSVLAWIVTALLALGLVMVYSASIATAEAGKFTGYQPNYYLIRHAVFVLIGLFAGIVVFQVPTKTWQNWAPYLFLLGVVLLLLVLIPGIGRAVNGSRRWLSLFVINLQPSELMKFFAVLYAADYAVRKGAVKNSLSKAFFPMFVVMALVGTLLLLEPDMGAFVVICAIAMGTLWLGGFNLKIFGLLTVALPMAFAALILSSPYRLQRVVGFMDPWSDPYGKGYQLSHALIAFGRGEWLGVGLGASVEK